jgi:hypothetical protein
MPRRIFMTLSAVLLTFAATPGFAGADESWGVWSASREGRLWTLRLSPEDSDNTVITFSCRTGSGRIRIQAPVHEGDDARVLELVSGDVSRSYRVTFREDVKGWIARARTTSRDPVMREFARTGRLRFGDGGPMNAGMPAAKAEVARFFNGCG